MHFNPAEINYAASAGVPFGEVFGSGVGVAGVLLERSVDELGYRAKIGAWMIALFLLAITPVMA